MKQRYKDNISSIWPTCAAQTIRKNTNRKMSYLHKWACACFLPIRESQSYSSWLFISGDIIKRFKQTSIINFKCTLACVICHIIIYQLRNLEEFNIITSNVASTHRQNLQLIIFINSLSSINKFILGVNMIV